LRQAKDVGQQGHRGGRGELRKQAEEEDQEGLDEGEVDEAGAGSVEEGTPSSTAAILFGLKLELKATETPSSSTIRFPSTASSAATRS